jgi:hypothetical protein
MRGRDDGRDVKNPDEGGEERWKRIAWERRINPRREVSLFNVGRREPPGKIHPFLQNSILILRMKQCG